MKIIELEKQFDKDFIDIKFKLLDALDSYDFLFLMPYIGDLQFTVLEQQKVINRLSRKIQKLKSSKRELLYELLNMVKQYENMKERKNSIKEIKKVENDILINKINKAITYIELETNSLPDNGCKSRLLKVKDILERFGENETN